LFHQQMVVVGEKGETGTAAKQLVSSSGGQSI
jgi:hypothetical protein